MSVEIGAVLEKTFSIGEKDTAKIMGSGELDVLATPMLVCYMENAAAELLGTFLDEESTSVGSFISVKHLAPSPVGDTIKITAKITEVEREKIIHFELLAEDTSGVVGKGEHQRAVVDKKRFMEKVDAR